MRQSRAWTRWTEAEARAALTSFAASGESELAFAQRNGISRQRLRYWRERLGRAVATPAFVAVEIPRSGSQTPTIEIQVGEVLVRVRESLDVEHVARLIRALVRAEAC
jgi:hypothetical protein